MEAMEYLKKREEICNEIMRSIGSCGLNACPLYYYDCGIPGNEEAMKRAIKFVDNYDLEKAPDSGANTEQEQ